jgi:predicted 3-demethylubiquinone-9 3-methyltransferase (glyoxalase superfamily)
MQPITPCLWFDRQAEEAAEFYVSLLPDSKITAVSYYGDGVPDRAGTALTVAFELNGSPFTALNGGPEFTFNESVSFQVHCDTTEQLDELWARLTEGGEESRCGWLKDRYGLSWQVIPAGFEAVLSDPDPERAGRAMQAMMGMSKLDIDALRAAADGS